MFIVAEVAVEVDEIVAAPATTLPPVGRAFTAILFCATAN